MKRLFIIQILLTTLLVSNHVDCIAQQSTDVQCTMEQIVTKDEESQGVSCMTVEKGSGLELVKMMFNKEFGKEFMRGVTKITVIDYSDASEETCMDIRRDLDLFISLLQEFDISEEQEFAENDYIRCFASASDTGTLSDFVIALEKDKSKMLMYMAGKIKVE